MKIIKLLAEKNIIDKDKVAQLEAQAKANSSSEEEVLLSQNIIDEASLFSLKSEALQIPLRQIDVATIPLKILELIPEDSAKYYKMVPLSRHDAMLEIGMVYPDDLNAKEALKFLSRQGNFSYQISLIVPTVFEAIIKRYRDLKGETTKALADLEEEIEKKKERAGAGGLVPGRFSEDTPVTKLVAVILRTAVDGGASDIHVEATKENVRVRFRSLGELHSSLALPLKAHQAIVARIKILANMRIDETRIPQDGRFSAMIDNTDIDFRVSTFPTALGEKVAIRVLDPSRGLKTFEELGLEGANLLKIKEAVKRPYGLILATGPTGSGKTTTLYAVLNSLNKEGVNIVSLEDPVEYVMEGVNQSQIRPEIGYDFASGLREILRQDPDIIMVGEVRDKEAATLVIHAALTGHIVLSTLHTNNALGVVPRLLDIGIDKYLIPATLSIAMSQRLIRRLCDDCKYKEKPSKAARDLIEKEASSFTLDLKKRVDPLLGAETFMLFRPKGCGSCGKSGYSSRIGIFEVLVMTEELAQIILENPSEAQIAKEAKRQGMITMRQDGIVKALDGLTTIEEIVRATEEE